MVYLSLIGDTKAIVSNNIVHLLSREVGLWIPEIEHHRF